jgi:L-threonylcarbamoyladenylate synthase
VAQALLRGFGCGVAAPSANRHGRVSATTAEHVTREFGSAVECVLDGGASQVGIESTIVDLSRGHPVLLRPGAITAAELAHALGQPIAAPDARSPRAPGMLARHYAPQTPLQLMEADLLLELAASLMRQGRRVAVLARSTLQPVLPGLTWIAAPQDAAGYAHDLYSNLRHLDEAGCDALLVEALPARPEWAAVQDRLNRAAAGADYPAP